MVSTFLGRATTSMQNIETNDPAMNMMAGPKALPSPNSATMGGDAEIAPDASGNWLSHCLKRLTRLFHGSSPQVTR